MESLAVRLLRINPRSIEAFYDKISGLARTPLTDSERARFAVLGTKIAVYRHGQVYWENGTRHQVNIWPHVERWDMYQPTGSALLILKERRDFHLNYVENALDWIFECTFEVEAAFEFVIACHVMLQRKSHVIQFYTGNTGSTRYTSGRIPGKYDPKCLSKRKTPTVLATYGDRPSKVTGEDHCLHFDHRTYKAQGLRRIGITCVADLITFDHVEFWRKQLLFCEINQEHLGRIYSNHQARQQNPGHLSRRSSQQGLRREIYDYQTDRRTGGTLMRMYGYTPINRIVRRKSARADELVDSTIATQNVIDAMRQQGVTIRKSLRTMDVKHLLPRKPKLQ